jgi:amidophosphoribosyltransferase
VLGKHVLEGIGRRTLAEPEAARSVSGWTGQQAGSPAPAGGADDALARP